ncbi:MAG: asparagine synthase (glutamine-hydrolyzing) [bacterium]
MCGICGILNFSDEPVSEELLKKMNDQLIHRGPDEEGYYIKPKYKMQNDGKCNVGMGIRRLSIIDLETGQQPIHNEDNSILVILNGEIYNFQELRHNLKKKGHHFYTKSDTEVLVHLYEDYGIDCLKYMNGMFAFALWDENKHCLFISRDRVGKKPLYYMRISDKFYFASEIKSFLVIPEFKKEVNLKAIHYYLTYQYIPSPMTIFKNVFRLPPASFMVVDSQGRIKSCKYWSLNFSHKIDLTFDEAKEKIGSLLRDAVGIRMIADVPLGAFLSGGHDSSIIVALMSQLSSQPVKTFSIGFEEQEFSELKYARILAKKFGCDHHEFIVKPDYIDILPKIVWHYDQPYADSSALPSFYVAKMTRQYVKVALNGDGGDENFAGYLRYSALRNFTLMALPFQIIPDKLFSKFLNLIPDIESSQRNPIRYAKRLLSALNESPSRRNVIWHCFFNNFLKKRIYSHEMKNRFSDIDTYEYLGNLFQRAPASGVIDRALYTDINAYLPEDLLIKMDVATMANSLEARSPFLDHHILEFTSSLPSSWKMKIFSQKYILKRTFQDLLPREILHRSKQGFGIPVGEWFRHQWKDYFREIVLSPKAKRGYFDMKEVEALFQEHILGKRDHGYRLWALFMLELWHRVFTDGDIVV